MQQTSHTVATVLVTYNRAAHLENVLKHLELQSRAPDSVIVIDNASTDGTSDMLRAYTGSLKLDVHRRQRNEGGAGGFAAGLEVAHKSGADYFWLMDDDCYPEADSLGELVEGLQRCHAAVGEPIAWAASLVRWIDGSVCVMNECLASEDWAEPILRGADATYVEQCSFVSMLIPRWAVEAEGLPLAQYFLWFDDAEYSARLRNQGRGIQVHSSVVTHALAENKGVNFGHVDSSNLWKFRLGARNESSYRWHHESPVRWLQFVLLTLVRMRRGRVRIAHRLTILLMIAKGLCFNPPVRFVE